MESDVDAVAAPVAYGRLRTGGADTGSSADTELMEEPNGRRNRYYAGNGRVYVDVGRRPEAHRIEAAKKVAAEFIAGRPNDNIGLTIFAGESFTQCPMTTDHSSLLSLLQNVRTDIAARGPQGGGIEDGTAIGMGLANAVSRLKDSKAKSRVVILLTDGSNNRGDLSPMTAAEIAKSLGIRVYTIGVGTKGTAPFPPSATGLPGYVNLPVEIDTKTLSDIAGATDGDFYRATNNRELQNIYKEIDKLEKSKLNVKQFSRRYEAYQPFAVAAVILLLLEILLRITIFRKLP